MKYKTSAKLRKYGRDYYYKHKVYSPNPSHRPLYTEEEDEKDPILRAKKIKEWCEEINKKYHNPKEELCTR